VVENERVHPGDADRGEAQILDEHEVWCNEVARLLVGRVRFPAEKHGRHVEKEQFRLDHSVKQDDGVIAVPILPDDRIILVRQFRHPVRMWLRELPRGGREKGEGVAQAAARELREEVGCETVQTYPLGRVTTDSGQQTGYPHLVAARVQEPAASEPEDTEAIDRLFRYTFGELLDACRRGRIVDSFTLAAVLRLEPHFDGDRFTYRPEYAPAD
jgi:ADP-ribose pyrophosphatase